MTANICELARYKLRRSTTPNIESIGSEHSVNAKRLHLPLQLTRRGKKSECESECESKERERDTPTHQTVEGNQTATRRVDGDKRSPRHPPEPLAQNLVLHKTIGGEGMRLTHDTFLRFYDAHSTKQFCPILECNISYGTRLSSQTVIETHAPRFYRSSKLAWKQSRQHLSEDCTIYQAAGALDEGNLINNGELVDEDDHIARDHDIAYDCARTSEEVHAANREAIKVITTQAEFHEPMRRQQPSHAVKKTAAGGRQSQLDDNIDEIDALSPLLPDQDVNMLLSSTSMHPEDVAEIGTESNTRKPCSTSIGGGNSADSIPGGEVSKPHLLQVLHYQEKQLHFTLYKVAMLLFGKEHVEIGKNEYVVKYLDKGNQPASTRGSSTPSATTSGGSLPPRGTQPLQWPLALQHQRPLDANANQRVLPMPPSSTPPSHLGSSISRNSPVVTTPISRSQPALTSDEPPATSTSQPARSAPHPKAHPTGTTDMCAYIILFTQIRPEAITSTPLFKDCTVYRDAGTLQEGHASFTAYQWRAACILYWSTTASRASCRDKISQGLHNM
ncbi:hypothetical protein PR048_016353 [Dryococelus australis]|uniref:Uncharacterized protein n=1 Tax=Dryococelus australis TaxID=614101 RepID=A0ABQ9HK20_9NEOP|nr:hypothetical protein PR048_016353 [Dryococelus australis]